MLKQRTIWVLLGLYLVLANIYGLVTPVMEASDELWHYPMVKYIADHGSLPIQEPGIETPWRQEGSQPPLYYALAALLTAWIDTSDLDQVRWINPHADNGIIRPDGNTNLIVHRSERFPWQGTVLAIHLIRFASVCMGAGTVYLTFLLVKQIWPTREGLALAAAGITAFNPMFCFISGSVNNDNLAMLLGAAGIWLLVRLVGRHGGAALVHRSTWWQDITVLGIVLGLALLTKPSTVGLLLLTALAVSFVARQRRSWWYFWTGGIVTAGLVILISGWWFLRNATLYQGDWTGIERFVVILGYRDPPATLRQLWGERHGFMMAYWGLFGGVNVPMPGWLYQVLNGALLVSGAGLLVWVVKRAIQRTPGAGLARIVRGIPALHAVQLGLLVLWPLAVILPWISWATRTWSSQGRLIFTAMSAWSAWTALGLSQFLPRPRAAWLRGAACKAPAFAVAAWMLCVAAWAPWAVIAPAYRAPLLPAGTLADPQYVLQADMGGQLLLLGYDLEVSSARPGEAFRLTLYWEAQGEMDRDWSVFFHLLDVETRLPIVTRDRFPGQGLLATSLLEPGTRWADRYVVDVPRTAYAPAEVVLEVGLYDVTNQERPPIQVHAGQVVAVVDNALRFQPLRIEAHAGNVPNPVQINFQDRLVLSGWDMDRRAVEPGQDTSLTLYWECTAEMEGAYTVSAQLLDESGRKAAQWDSWPGDVDTSRCTVGQRMVDVRTLAIYPDAPSGGYRLALMIYDSQSMKRLRIVDEQGRILPEDRVFLDWVKVGP